MNLHHLTIISIFATLILLTVSGCSNKQDIQRNPMAISQFETQQNMLKHIEKLQNDSINELIMLEEVNMLIAQISNAADSAASAIENARKINNELSDNKAIDIELIKARNAIGRIRTAIGNEF